MDLGYILFGAVITLAFLYSNGEISEEEKTVSDFLEYVNKQLAILWDQETLAKWQNEISLNKDFSQTEIAADALIKFKSDISKDLAKFKNYPTKNPGLKRQISLIPEPGYEVLPEKDLELMKIVTKNLSNMNDKVTLCSYEDKNFCNLTYFPEVLNIMQRSKNVKELEFYWLERQSKVQAVVVADFKIFVHMFRKAAKMNGYIKPSDFWLRDYKTSSKTIMQHLEKLILQLKPLFEQAHAYVRGKLRSIYGTEWIEYNKPLPEHLFVPFLHNFLDNLAAVEKPFKKYEITNITDILLKKKSTAETNFGIAIDFLKSLGMPKLEKSYWEKNAAPLADVEAMDDTHKAWKFYASKSVKFSYNHLVKDSTFLNMFEAVSVIYYYRAKENLTTLYQREPIPDFAGAVGKFFGLAALSPNYLKKLGMADPHYRAKKNRINRLYIQGLQFLMYIPLFYLLDRYRMDLMDKNVGIKSNCAYWQLTEDFYGVQPPVPRTSAAFDAFQMFITNVDQQYTKEIYNIVLQYQMFEHFCTLTGEYVKDDPKKPLDLCDLTGYPEVGQQI